MEVGWAAEVRNFGGCGWIQKTGDRQEASSKPIQLTKGSKVYLALGQSGKQTLHRVFTEVVIP